MERCAGCKLLLVFSCMDVGGHVRLHTAYEDATCKTISQIT